MRQWPAVSRSEHACVRSSAESRDQCLGGEGGVAGGGEGEGSCAAPPFRAHYVKWTGGCPGFAPCCSEYGFCRPLVSGSACET